MKKIACIVLALLLCLSMAAMAESVPSRTTTDLTTVTVAAENMPADANFTLTPITEVDPANMTPEMQVRVEACNAEIAKLNESGNAVEYFGEVTDANGNAVSLTELLGTDEVNVYEFFPLSAEGFEVEYGAVTATMVFSTPMKRASRSPSSSVSSPRTPMAPRALPGRCSTALAPALLKAPASK